MIITNKTYYHFQRINDININWKVGDKLHFNSDRNNFYYSGLKEAAYKILKDNGLSGSVIEELKGVNGKSALYSHLQTQVELLLSKIDSKDEIDKLIQFFQEIVYEQIRIKKFPNLPSRLYCIWLVKELEEIREWEEILSCLRSRILLVKLNGVMHKTSGKLICTKKNRLIENAVSNANKYWESNVVLNGEPEYLFEGEIEIIQEIIDEI